MGTKAIFAIGGVSGATYYTRIIGCTSDGSVENLKYFASEIVKLAKEYRKLTLFRKCDFETVKFLQDKLVEKNDGWLFVDEVKNAVWVSNSAIFYPKNNQLDIFEDKFEHKVSTIQL